MTLQCEQMRRYANVADKLFNRWVTINLESMQPAGHTTRCKTNLPQRHALLETHPTRSFLLSGTCVTRGSHSDACKLTFLLGYIVVQCHNIQRNMSQAAGRDLLSRWRLSADYAVLHSWRQNSSWPPLWEERESPHLRQMGRAFSPGECIEARFLFHAFNCKRRPPWCGRWTAEVCPSPCRLCAAWRVLDSTAQSMATAGATVQRYGNGASYIRSQEGRQFWRGTGVLVDKLWTHGGGEQLVQSLDVP
jgi:hypothetical protein